MSLRRFSMRLQMDASLPREYEAKSCAVYLVVSDEIAFLNNKLQYLRSSLPRGADALNIGTGELPRRLDLNSQEPVVILDLTTIANADRVISHFSLEFPAARCVGIFDSFCSDAYMKAVLLKAKYGRPHGFIPVSAGIETSAAVLCVVNAGGEVLPWRQPSDRPTAKLLPIRPAIADHSSVAQISASSGGSKEAGSDLALTVRERQVLRLLTTGMQNKVMANKLGISENTIRIHIHHILRKLGVRNRTEAANAGIRSGLFTMGFYKSFETGWAQFLTNAFAA
jgi:DNA-binding NarL/FixJ family response regulator